MKFFKNVASKFGWLAGISVIFFAVASWFLFKSIQPQGVDLDDRLIALKQDIINLKTYELDVLYEAKKIYNLGLLAELEGDIKLAQEDYTAAEKIYFEARHNIKKALEKSKIDIGPILAELNQIDGNEGIKSIKQKVNAHYQQALKKERAHLTQMYSKK